MTGDRDDANICPARRNSSRHVHGVSCCEQVVVRAEIVDVVIDLSVWVTDLHFVAACALNGEDERIHVPVLVLDQNRFRVYRSNT